MKKTPFIAMIAVLSAFRALAADAPSPSEYEIKGAFLYNFAKFVEWPADAFKKNPDHFVIGILGHDPFGGALDDELEGKTIQDKTLVLKRLSQPEDAVNCNMLFISASKSGELPAILQTLQGVPVLTVSDMAGFAEHGGVVGFSIDNRRVRFNVNTKAADSAGLKISSQLLKLAKTVISKVWLAPEIYAWLPSGTIQSKRS